MKTKTQMSKLVAGAAIVLAAVSPSFGQNNLGSGCGCPPVNARTTVTVSSLPGFTVIPGTYGGELLQGGNWTCDKTYILDQKIYIPSGQILNIQPGTVIKGRATLTGTVNGFDPATATALVIERGGKIIASGTKNCPIVFTAEADPVDNSYPLANKGMWGGVVILGKATNNLSLAANGPYVAGCSNTVCAGKLAVADGLGTIEGFATSNVQDRFGVNLSSTPIAGEVTSGTFDDNDNSGILRYVSIRHSGAILQVGSEINGLTLGSVGRGTSIDNIEIVSCADDNIELFGGTVNLKYVSTIFGNDDMFDYDLGWTGKAQFLFGMAADNTFSIDNDNGFEMDSDDGKSNNLPRSTPVIYNATIIGSAKTANTADNSALAGINAKELTGGEINNSIFANFFRGFNVIKSVGTVRAGTSEAYHNWSTANGNGSNILKIKCNTFVGVTNSITVGGSAGAVLPADITQFATTDLNVNVVGNTLPGFTYSYTVNSATNVFALKNDVIPNPALAVTGCPVAPVDGFFVAAPYRGAFASAGDNWLSDWSYSGVLGATRNIVACPADINKDGIINISDFLILIPVFNSSCN